MCGAKVAGVQRGRRKPFSLRAVYHPVGGPHPMTLGAVTGPKLGKQGLSFENWDLGVRASQLVSSHIWNDTMRK